MFDLVGLAELLTVVNTKRKSADGGATKGVAVESDENQHAQESLEELHETNALKCACPGHQRAAKSHDADVRWRAQATKEAETEICCVPCHVRHGICFEVLWIVLASLVKEKCTEESADDVDQSANQELLLMLCVHCPEIRRHSLVGLRSSLIHISVSGLDMVDVLMKVLDWTLILVFLILFAFSCILCCLFFG